MKYLCQLGFKSRTFVKGGFIVCALRSMDENHGLEMADLAGKYRAVMADEIGVVGFDVAGDEGKFPLNSRECAMYKVRQAFRNVPTTF